MAGPPSVASPQARTMVPATGAVSCPPGCAGGGDRAGPGRRVPAPPAAAGRAAASPACFWRSAQVAAASRAPRPPLPRWASSSASTPRSVSAREAVIGGALRGGLRRPRPGGLLAGLCGGDLLVERRASACCAASAAASFGVSACKAAVAAASRAPARAAAPRLPGSSWRAMPRSTSTPRSVSSGAAGTASSVSAGIQRQPLDQRQQRLHRLGPGSGAAWASASWRRLGRARSHAASRRPAPSRVLGWRRRCRGGDPLGGEARVASAAHRRRRAWAASCWRARARQVALPASALLASAGVAASGPWRAGGACAARARSGRVSEGESAFRLHVTRATDRRARSFPSGCFRPISRSSVGATSASRPSSSAVAPPPISSTGTGLVVCAVCGPPVAGSRISSQLP